MFCAGRIVDTLVCLKDKRLTERIEARIDPTPNLRITCSDSGKMTKTHIDFYCKGLEDKMKNEESYVLAVDSWGGHKDQALYNRVKDKCLIEVIPEKTTSLVQPLDTGIHRYIQLLC